MLPYMPAVLGIGEIPWTVSRRSHGIDRCKEVGLMPKKKPVSNWLSLVIKIVLDWRFLLALAVLVRVLLNK